MADEHLSREHLFISYAIEDSALADWLTLRLTAAGYRVWCDRYKLLGGEPWPKDIDRAIKERTFRLLHLLSHSSKEKPNPSKERELALTIGRVRGISDFLIPLNVDGVRPIDLPWTLSDINYIPFQDWASGLRRLLAKLESIEAPRPLRDSGPTVAAEAYLPPDVLSESEEPVLTNCIAVEQIPKTLFRFESNRPLDSADIWTIRDLWAFRKIDDRLVVAFGSPPKNLPAHLRFRPAGGFLWASNRLAHGIDARNLLSELIRKAADVYLLNHGLCWSDRRDLLYAPIDLLPGDRIPFVGYNGRRTHVMAGGEQRAGAEYFQYRLGVSLYVRQNLLDEFMMILRPRLHITDCDGKEIDYRLALRRRKRVTKSWFNHQWVNRVLALYSLFGDGSHPPILATGGAGESLTLASALLASRVSPSVLESRLDELGHTDAEPPPDSFDEDELDAKEDHPTPDGD